MGRGGQRAQQASEHGREGERAAEPTGGRSGVLICNEPVVECCTPRVAAGGQKAWGRYRRLALLELTPGGVCMRPGRPHGPASVCASRRESARWLRPRHGGAGGQEGVWRVLEPAPWPTAEREQTYVGQSVYTYSNSVQHAVQQGAYTCMTCTARRMRGPTLRKYAERCGFKVHACRWALRWSCGRACLLPAWLGYGFPRLPWSAGRVDEHF